MYRKFENSFCIKYKYILFKLLFKIITCKYIFRGCNSVIFILNISIGVSYSRKEFVPAGANSFLSEWTPLKGFNHLEKQTGCHNSCSPL